MSTLNSFPFCCCCKSDEKASVLDCQFCFCRNKRRIFGSILLAFGKICEDVPVMCENMMVMLCILLSKSNAKCVSRLCNWIMDWYFWNTLDWVFFRFHWIFRNKFLVKYTFTFYFTIFVYYCLPSAYIKNYNNKKLLSIGVWYFLHKCLFPPRDEFQRMQHIVSFPFCGLDFLINYIMRQALTKPGKCANPIVLHSEWFGEEMKWKKREENYHHRKPKLLAARLPELCLKGLTVLRSFRVIVM